MKNAIIYFEGKEVTQVLCDEVLSFEIHSFNLQGKEVAVFPNSYGYVLIDFDSRKNITEEEKDSIRETIKKEFIL